MYHRTLITAIKYPHAAAVALFLFVIGRVGYTRGYITGDPAKVIPFSIRILKPN